MPQDSTKFQLPYDNVVENGLAVEEVMARAWSNYTYTMDWVAENVVEAYRRV